MPKKVKVKNRFDGGINTKSSAKDIGDNDLVSAKNVFVNEFGTIKSGSKAQISSGNSLDYVSLPSTNIQAGYGLFQAELDHKRDNNNTPVIKTFVNDLGSSSNKMEIKDSEDSGAWASTFSITANHYASAKTIFHMAEGNLRISDTNFEVNTNASVRWFGHINKTLFSGLTFTNNINQIDGYYNLDNKMTTPGNQFTVASSQISYPETAGNSIHAYINQTDGGEWTAGTYQIGETFVYDGNQESLIKVGISNFVISADGKKLGITVGARAPYNERITDTRMYIRENGTNDPWILLADISLKKGIRTQLDSEYSAWLTVSDGVKVKTGEKLSLKPNIDTYESVNGYSPDESSISIGEDGESYKTSVVTNGRTFVANLKTKNEDDETLHMPDRIMYSQVTKYDIFPTSNYIDIGTNDGDEFVKLESFADRLFAYKKNKLYIINISGGADTQWYLESEYNSLGVESHNSVVKVDLGIIWANKNGLYLYDGTSVSNLQNKIDDQTWFDFCKGNTLMIGFLPKKKEIVIMEGASNGNTDAYIYHLETKSFVFINNLFPINYTYTNLILDTNGKLTTYGNGGNAEDLMFSYDGLQVKNKDSELIFNFDDFGDTKNIKKLYKIIVTYTTKDQEGNGLITTPFSYNYTNEAGTVASGTLFNSMIDTNGATQVDNFLFNENGTPLKAHSLQLIFTPATIGDGSGVDTSIWSINDITIVYRTIGKVVT